jgi:hypothetical protein
MEGDHDCEREKNLRAEPLLWLLLGVKTAKSIVVGPQCSTQQVLHQQSTGVIKIEGC